MSDLSSRQIEQDLAAERAALARSLAELHDRFAPKVLVEEGKAALRHQMQPMLERLDVAVRSRPLTAAVAGLALVTMVLGSRRSHAPAEKPALAGTRSEALMRWDDEGGLPVDPHDNDDEEWLSEAMGLRSRSQKLLSQIDDAVRRGLAPAAELAAHRTAVTAAMARDTTKALGRGLETLTGTAREQALAARERLYHSRLALRGRAEAMIETHPVAAGLAMATVGAAAAWLFPPTEAEDRILGEVRDRMVDDLRHAVREEAMQASALARTIKDAVKSDLSTVGSVVTPVREDAPVRPH